MLNRGQGWWINWAPDQFYINYQEDQVYNSFQGHSRFLRGGAIGVIDDNGPEVAKNVTSLFMVLYNIDWNALEETYESGTRSYG